MYLIYGESFRLVEEEIAKIIKKETNIVTMDLSTTSIQDVLTEATYVSLFQEKKILIVKNAYLFTSAKTKEEDIEIFLSYMESPSSLTTIIFVTYEKIDARKKITKSFEKKYRIINVGGLSRNDLMSKVREYVFSNSYKIDTDALQYIVNACGDNYDLIYNELNKLFLFYGEPQSIQLADVKEIVSKSLQDNNFKFVEAVIEKDMMKSLRILEDLYTLKVDPISLLLLLAREYRLIFSVKLLSSLGYPKSVVSKKIGLQDWQTERVLRNASSYYEDTLKEYLKKLAILDYQIKKGETDKFLALKVFLLSLD